MPVRLQCHQCAVTLKVKEELIGKRIKCPKCGTVFSAVAATEALNPTAIKNEASSPVERPSGESVGQSREFECLVKISTKRPLGHNYHAFVTNQGIAFTCLTVDDKGRVPTSKESSQLDFQLTWDEITQVIRPAAIDPIVKFVGKDGGTIECSFADAGDENAVFGELKNVFGTLPGVTFTYKPKPLWMRLFYPIGWVVLWAAGGIGMYFLFAGMEAKGGRVRIHVFLALIYALVGKTGILALCLILAACGIPMAVSAWRRHATESSV